MELFVFCKVHLLTRLFLPIESSIPDNETRNCVIVSRTKHANERVVLPPFADVGLLRGIDRVYLVEHKTQDFCEELVFGIAP